MDTLTPHQYETVLKYMETSNQQSFEHAVSLMAQYNFNLKHFNQSQTQHTNSEHQIPFHPDSDSLQHNQIVKRYQEYLTAHRHQNSIKSRLRTACQKSHHKIRILCKNIFPCLYSVVFRSPFQKLYPQTETSYSINLNECLEKSMRMLKPCLVIISGNQFNNFINQFLNEDESQLQQFQIVGLVQNRQTEQFFNRPSPCIVICRKNISNKIQIITSFGISQTSIITRIRELMIEVRNEFGRLQSIDDYIRYGQRQLEMDSYDGPHEVLLSSHETVGSKEGQFVKILEEQNHSYKIMEEQAKRLRQKRQHEERIKQQQLRRIEEIKEERAARKLSIPNEPFNDQGEGVASLQFRCPDGSYIKRNFMKNQKIQLLYMWVETNEQIVFENQNDRLFQLLISYPPIPLNQKKEQIIEDVVEGVYENVIIRQI